MSLTYKISREKLVLRAHAHRHGCRNAFFVGGRGGGVWAKNTVLV